MSSKNFRLASWSRTTKALWCSRSGNRVPILASARTSGPSMTRSSIKTGKVYAPPGGPTQGLRLFAFPQLPDGRIGKFGREEFVDVGHGSGDMPARFPKGSLALQIGDVDPAIEVGGLPRGLPQRRILDRKILGQKGDRGVLVLAE